MCGAGSGRIYVCSVVVREGMIDRLVEGFVPLPFSEIGSFSRDFFGMSERVTAEEEEEEEVSPKSFSSVCLPGSENEECSTFPFRSGLSDSLLLVDEKDIAELSSAGLGRRWLDVSVDGWESW